MATEKQVERALRSTLGKMAKWVRTRSIRSLQQNLKIPQKILRRRIKVMKRRTGNSIAIFYGENAVAAILLKPKKTSTGVTAAGRDFPGAFIANGKGGKQQVFKRSGSARLPLVRQEVEIKKDTDEFLEREFITAAAFAEQFYKVFEHEIEWQTRH